MGRHHPGLAANYTSPLKPHLASCTNPEAAIVALVLGPDKAPSVSFARRQLFIDVSHIAQFDFRTGIQRVVKEIVQALYLSDRTGFEPVAVELVEGKLRPATTWLHTRGLLLPHELVSSEETLTFRPGDVLLMLDSSWLRYREFFPTFEYARKRHVSIYTVVYDLLLPTLSPEHFPPGGREMFKNWLQDAIVESDGLVCISRSVADEVVSWMATSQIDKWPKVGYWHLGCDLQKGSRCEQKPSPEIEALVSKSYLLMVGTIEPRKSHALALAAIEQLWDRNRELCLCIVGKEGWMTSDLMTRLRSHPLRGDKLFLFEELGDSDLSFLYTHSAGLIFLSKGEGFGLPLVEAANYGTPIICSDIPVFHEIAGNYATYVSDNDAVTLAQELEAWWQKRQMGQLPNTQEMPRLTWKQSSVMLLQVILDNHWYNKELKNENGYLGQNLVEAML